MPCQFIFTNRFQKRFKALNENEKKQIRNKLVLLSDSSLRTKRIQGTDDLFECSANMDICIIGITKAIK